MRFLDYDRYLHTALWRKIKVWVLARDAQQCVVCHRKKISPKVDDMDVHHRCYDLEVLEGRRDEMLVSLCTACHKRVEFYKDGSKRTSLGEKDVEFFRLKDLHQRIEKTGMCLRLVSRSSVKATSFDVTYVGEQEFLEFYTVDDVMMKFILHFSTVRQNLSGFAESAAFPE